MNSDEDQRFLAATSFQSEIALLSSDEEQDDVEGNDLYLF